MPGILGRPDYGEVDEEQARIKSLLALFSGILGAPTGQLHTGLGMGFQGGSQAYDQEVARQQQVMSQGFQDELGAGQLGNQAAYQQYLQDNMAQNQAQFDTGIEQQEIDRGRLDTAKADEMDMMRSYLFERQHPIFQQNGMQAGLLPYGTIKAAYDEQRADDIMAQELEQYGKQLEMEKEAFPNRYSRGTGSFGLEDVNKMVDTRMDDLKNPDGPGWLLPSGVASTNYDMVRDRVKTKVLSELFPEPEPEKLTKQEQLEKWSGATRKEMGGQPSRTGAVHGAGELTEQARQVIEAHVQSGQLDPSQASRIYLEMEMLLQSHSPQEVEEIILQKYGLSIFEKVGGALSTFGSGVGKAAMLPGKILTGGD